MNFADAVRSCLSQYTGFSGRARRSEYWWFVLFNLVISLVAFAVDRAINLPILGLLVSLALLLPGLAVTVRRLHDTGRSGGWIFIGLIPFIGAIVLLIFACQDSAPGANAYGAYPKDAGGPGLSAWA